MVTLLSSYSFKGKKQTDLLYLLMSLSMLLLLVFADHVHDDDHGDDDHWSGGVAVLLRLPNLPVDHLNTFSKCTNTEHNRSTNNNSITLGKATRPDQNKKGGKNQQQLWHPFNGIDWTDSADSSNKKHIAPSLTRLGTFPHIHGCRRRRGGKTKKKTFPAAVKACCCCGCRCHFRPCFAYLAAWLSWVFSLCTKLSVSAFPWLNGNATAVAPLPFLKSEACSHCLHVTFKFCLCSFFVMALLFSNCGILNSMEDIADRSLLGWRIN